MESYTSDRSLPLRRNWFHILLALSRGAAHGYAVMKEVQAHSGGGVRLWPATLYGALRDMADGGLIEEVPASQSTATDARERRSYRITAAGSKALNAEAKRLAALVSLVRDSDPAGTV